jgi:hypothetical protein
LEERRGEIEAILLAAPEGRFFEERAPACLRGMPEGETLLIIYIKMLLRGIRSDGMFQYSGTYPSNTDEIAAQIQEDPKLVRLPSWHLRGWEQSMSLKMKTSTCFSFRR